MSRNALDKQTFLSGVRQKWAVVFLVWGAAILAVSIYHPHVTIAPFLSYAGMIGSTFILGLSVDSAIKTNSAAKTERNKGDYNDAK